MNFVTNSTAIKTENGKLKIQNKNYPLSIILHTNLRAENFRRSAGKLSSAIGGRRQDIARVFQKCSNSCRRLRKSIRENLYPHTTSDWIFAAAICRADSESG
jgi:hypothetical protein